MKRFAQGEGGWDRGDALRYVEARRWCVGGGWEGWSGHIQMVRWPDGQMAR